MTAETGMDNGLTDALVRSRRYFTRGTVSEDLINALHPEIPRLIDVRIG